MGLELTCINIDFRFETVLPFKKYWIKSVKSYMEFDEAYVNPKLEFLGQIGIKPPTLFLFSLLQAIQTVVSEILIKVSVFQIRKLTFIALINIHAIAYQVCEFAFLDFLISWALQSPSSYSSLPSTDFCCLAVA